MKKWLLNFSFIVFTMNVMSQVCDKEVASWVKAPGGYAIAGKASIKFVNKKWMLSLSQDFSTISGPDLHIYLGTKNSSPNAVGNYSELVAVLKSNKGMQEYEIPTNLKLDTFSYVLIHCLAGNHFWGGGEMKLLEGSCKDTTSTSDGTAELKAIQGVNSMWHYDVKSKSLLSTNEHEFANISIYTSIGGIVLHESKGNNLTLGHLETGVYIGLIQDKNGNVSRLKFEVKE